MKKCFYILELGINIIGALALLLDVFWIGGNNTLIITKNNNIITRGMLK